MSERAPSTAPSPVASPLALTRWCSSVTVGPVFGVRAARRVRAPGKAVRIRRDPVTVIGNETRDRPLIRHEPDREGAGSRTIREPGDLPDTATPYRSSREDPGD